MSRRPRRRSEADLYHVVSRGVNKVHIFEDDADCERFMEMLSSALSDSGAELYCWCLMGNHFHLLIASDLDQLSSMLKQFIARYAQYFNMRHGRSGHLFQDRFSSEPIDSDEYLLTVVRYIHRNPIKAGLSNTCEYRWSSYAEYISCSRKTWASTSRVLDIFGGVDEFLRFHSIEAQEDCLDIPCLRARMTDEEAASLATELLGGIALQDVESLPRSERDEALRALRRGGMSIRQVQRLTGVGRNIIARVNP